MKLPSLDLLRKAVRPMTQLMIIIMIGPLAVAVGLVEAFVPGAGVRFANGMLTYIKGLPESFWLFAAGAVGVHTIARSFGKDKEAEAAESMVEAAKIRRATDEEEAR